MVPCQGACPGAIPGNRTNFRQVAHQPVQPSLQNSACLGQHQGGLPFWGRGRQAMHLPCKQADVGALPTDSTNFKSLRETRPMHRGKPHKLPQVGVTPTPATNFREVIRLPDRKSGVAKQSRK
jgi:hypothetical protein